MRSGTELSTFLGEGENDNRRRMAWNAHAHIYTINS